MKNLKRVIALVCVLLMMFSFAGCGGLEISRELATVNGRVVTKAEYMYYLENIKQQMLAESGTDDAEAFWDAEIDGEKASEVAKKKALEEMLRIEIACIKAEEKGLSVSETELTQIRSYVKTNDSQQKAQIDMIKDMTGMSDDQLIAFMTKTSLANAYASDIYLNDAAALEVSEEEIKAAYEQEYVHVKHILIGSTQEPELDENGNPIEGLSPLTPEEYREEQKKKADEVLAKVKDGANFDAMIAEYNEDPGMESSPEGYTFTKGEMVPQFEDASYGLAEGEISDLVETDYGWHIIKRLPLPKSGEGYDAALGALEGTLSQGKYNELIDSYKSEVTVEIRQSVVDGIKIK